MNRMNGAGTRVQLGVRSMGMGGTNTGRAALEIAIAGAGLEPATPAL